MHWKKQIVSLCILQQIQCHPLSLLEFGLYAQSKKMKVIVEEGFWRKGNIDIVCERYAVEQFKTLDELIQNLLK